MASVAPKPERQHGFEEFLRANGASIARLIDPAPHHASMGVTLLKAGDASTVAKLTYMGQTKLLKRYEEGFTDSYKKEVTTLRFLRQSGLAPKIEHACADERYLITTFVNGSSVSDKINQENLSVFCYIIGSWISDYSKAVPHVPVESNWLEYFRQNEEMANAPAVDVYSGLLERTKISKKVLSRGDSILGNFLQSDTGDIVGIDYEHASMKPMGWDLLHVAKAMARRFPQDIDTIASGLADGFTLKSPGSMSRYQSLIKIFVAATAFGELKEESEVTVGSPYFTSKTDRKNQFANILRKLRKGDK